MVEDVPELDASDAGGEARGRRHGQCVCVCRCQCRCVCSCGWMVAVTISLAEIV